MRRILALGLVAIVTGCGSTGAGDGSSAAERSRARSRTGEGHALSDLSVARTALLRLKDFPQGWDGVATSMPARRCGEDTDRTATASAISPLFEQGDSAVQQIVWTFRDEDAAQKVYATAELSQPKACLRQIVREQVRQRRNGDLGPMRVVSQETGVRHRHVRLSADGHTLVQTPLGEADSIVEIITDVEVARVGRSISLIVMLSTTQPLDQAAQDYLMDLVDRRLARSSAGAGT